MEKLEELTELAELRGAVRTSGDVLNFGGIQKVHPTACCLVALSMMGEGTGFSLQNRSTINNQAERSLFDRNKFTLFKLIDTR